MQESPTRWHFFPIPQLNGETRFCAIDEQLSSLEGIVTLHPDYDRRAVLVIYRPEVTSLEQISAGIEKLDLPDAHESHTDEGCGHDHRHDDRLTLVGLILLVIGTICWFASANPYHAVFTIGAAVISGWPVFQGALHAIQHRQLDMNVLMSIAVCGALLVGESFEAATAMVLFGISIWLEHRSLHRANEAVESLVELTPDLSFRKNLTGEFEEITSADIRPGDVLLVKPGARIAVDGEVIEGTSEVNEAPITGESNPVAKSVKDSVYAGGLNMSSAMQIVATSTVADSSLSRITELVRDAQKHRSPTERMIDRFARGYTPIVVVVALVVFLIPSSIMTIAEGGFTTTALATIREWFHRALVLLVIACPCALVISTPITIVCGLRRAAKLGAVVKGGQYLELLARIRGVLLDKTGTVTHGELSVVNVLPQENFREHEVLRLAASLEAQSSHPVAAAIFAKAGAESIQLPEATNVRSQPGIGLSGNVDGHEIYCGRPEKDSDVKESASEATLVEVRRDGHTVGSIELTDTIRDDAWRMVDALRQLGISHVAMLSGDRQIVATKVGTDLDLDEVRADLLPQGKIDWVKRKLQRYSPLAMVGDGVNDAPALTAASVGIAFGPSSSDTALHSADIAVLSPRLMRIPHLIQLSRETTSRLHENIYLALGIKLLVFVLALLGIATMWMAVAADVGSSMLVIANGMRVLRFDPDAGSTHE